MRPTIARFSTLLPVSLRDQDHEVCLMDGGGALVVNIVTEVRKEEKRIDAYHSYAAVSIEQPLDPPRT